MELPTTPPPVFHVLSTRAKEDVGHAVFDGRNATSNAKETHVEPANA
jgi:hypothetical protein